MTITVCIPSPEELSNLSIEDFKKLLASYKGSVMHDAIFCMLLEVSVDNYLLDHYKWLQTYALETNLTLEAEDLNEFFEQAIENKQIDFLKFLMQLIRDEKIKDKAAEVINILLYEKIVQDGGGDKEVYKLFKGLLSEENTEKLIYNDNMFLIIEFYKNVSEVLKKSASKEEILCDKAESGKVIKPLKALVMLEPSYREWLVFSLEKIAKKILNPYLELDIVNLRNMSFAMGNLFTKKGVELASKNQWKQVFTSDNEIILAIAEFLSGNGTGRYIKEVMPAIREALGINGKFIDLYDFRIKDVHSIEVVSQEVNLDEY